MTASRRNLVVLAAGGTGGHMFPAEALAGELLRRGCAVALITDKRGGSFSAIGGAVETHRILAGGVAGKSLFKRIRGVHELAFGTLQARRLLKKLSPRVVIGFGGYASAPTMLAAGFSGFTTAIHEQNAVLGRANRLLAARASRIATSFETVHGLPAEAAGKTVHTGMPVRPLVIAVRDVPYPAIDKEGPLKILVLGGSQGAHVFSGVLPQAVEMLAEGLRNRLEITQQCRPEDLEAARQAYSGLGVKAELSSFFDDVPARLSAAHLVIARAGASTVAEVTAAGRPAILVPYPHAIDDHQSLNAHSVDEAGAGWLMPEDLFNAAALAARLDSLFDLPAILEQTAACAFKAGRPDAAERLADMVFELLPSNGEPEERRQAA